MDTNELEKSVDAGTDIYTLMGNMSYSDVRYKQQYAKVSKTRAETASERIKLEL